MGLGPQNIELYRQLKLLGALDGINNVMELGSQDFWCPQPNLMKALVAAFGQTEPPPDLLRTSISSQLPARRLYEALGLAYNCVDVDGRDGTLALDLNFDSLPAAHKGLYGLVTNYGTSEHILDQHKVFRTMHDLARPGGVMIHGVPFMGYVDHGFFSYHPNFFECLARYNSYETLGVWIGPGSDGRLVSYIPWDPKLLGFLTLAPDSAHILVVAQRKMYDREFCVPLQETYEDKVPDDTVARYAMVIDGEVMDGKRVKYLTTGAVAARNQENEIKRLKTEVTGLNNWIDSYKGRIDGLKHELAVTKNELESARHGQTVAAPMPVSSPDLSLRNTPGKELVAEMAFRLRRRLGF